MALAYGKIDESPWRKPVYQQITQVKSAYFCTLDAKQWDEFAALLTVDCDYTMYNTPKDANPKRKTGRDEIAASIRRKIGNAVTFHQGFVRKIEIHAPDRASAVWDMADSAYIQNGSTRRIFRGNGRYHEQYELHGDNWLISRLELRRTWIRILSDERN